MALSTGLDAQIGFAEETTYGTFVAPTVFLTFTSEGLSRSEERVESDATGTGEMVLHEDSWETGRAGGEGPVEFEWPDRGTRVLGKHMLGKVTSTQPDPTGAPTVWEHVCEVDPLDGKSLSVQVGRPNAVGVVKPWSYPGAKVAEWTLSNEVDGLLLCSISFDVRDEDKSEPLAVKSFPTGQRKLAWTKGSITIDGTEIPVTSVELSGSNSMKTDRFFLQTTSPGLKDEPLDGHGRREYGGSLAGEYRPELEALYDAFVAGTTAPLVAEWKGREIVPGFNYGLRVDAPSIRIDGGTPNVDGAEAIEQGVDFTVLGVTGQSPIKFTITDDQAPA